MRLLNRDTTVTIFYTKECLPLHDYPAMIGGTRYCLYRKTDSQALRRKIDWNGLQVTGSR